MGTPGSPPTRLMAVPDKYVRPTRRLADLSSGPNRSSWRSTRTPEDLPEDSIDDLVQHDLKTWRTRQDIGGFRLSRSTGYGKRCNQLDLGLLVVIDQESATSSAGQYKANEATPCTIMQSSSNLHRQLDVGCYSLEARTSTNSSCSLCSTCSCTTFKFLALDSTSPNN
jgi:hypothetical protein